VPTLGPPQIVLTPDGSLDQVEDILGRVNDRTTGRIDAKSSLR